MPTTALIIGAVVAIGVGTKIVGIQAEAAAQAAQAEAQAEAAEINALQAESDAAYVRDITIEEVRKFRRQADKFQSTQKSAIGGSGLRMSGSALQLVQETEIEIARDVESIQKAGAQRAEGLETQAEVLRVQGGAYEAAGQAALTAGIIGSASTLLTGLTGFVGSFPGI